MIAAVKDSYGEGRHFNEAALSFIPTSRRRVKMRERERVSERERERGGGGGEVRHGRQGNYV